MFIRTNMILTSAWGLTFTINAILAWGKLERFILPELGYEIISYTLMFVTAAFTSWYPGYIRQKAGNITHNAPKID